MPSTTSRVSLDSSCYAQSRAKTATSWSRNGSPRRRSKRGRPVLPSRRTPVSGPTPWPRGHRFSSSRLCWTLQGPARRRNAGRVRRAAGLTVAIVLVIALACGCANTGTAPTADAAYGVPIDINTPQGLRAKQTMDMLNSDWPIGEANVRTMATPELVEHVGVTLDRIWWDRPFTLTNVDVGAGHATLDVLTSYGVAQTIELRTDE